MKNAFSAEKLSNTDGKIDFTSRVKILLANSPLIKRKRSMSLSTLTHTGPSPSLVFKVQLDVLVTREGGEIPFIIKKIVEYIEQNDLDTEGIYRVNGNAKTIEKLKTSFDKVCDANFHGEDVAAVAGLLKLFLRELPDGIIPQDMVPQFVQVQQCHPREATPEALSLLQHCINSLPPIHYSVLRYLIRHLAKVAQHSAENKMTPVSLSIVFGPNIFHCGEGIAALQLQGYSNSTVCRMIQHHEILFGEQEREKEVVLRKRSSPSKPRPYSEHIVEKKMKQDYILSPVRNSTIAESTSDLERTYSERSIDEAVMDRSSGTISPTSPSHLRDVSSPVSRKSPPPRPPPPKIKSPLRQLPLVVNTPNEDTVVKEGADSLQKVDQEDDDSPFQRRNAKRGLKFTPRSPEKGERSSALTEDAVNLNSPLHNSGYNKRDISNSMAEGPALKHSKLSMLSAREDETVLRTPSPYSWQSSPGGSPNSSPAITPRSSRVMSSVIDQSIKQYLFQPPASQQLPESKPLKPLSNNRAAPSAEGPKADVYGLLLPDKLAKASAGAVCTSHTNTSTLATTVPTSTDDLVESVLETEENKSPKDVHDSEAMDTGLHDGSKSGPPVVKRRSSTGTKKLRNRKSSLYAEFTEPPQKDMDSVSANPMSGMNVQILSVSPEHPGPGETGIESRQGRLSDLVQQFEHREVEDVVAERDISGKGKRRKPSNTAFEMFERKGIVIGMGSPPPQDDEPRGSTNSSHAPLHSSGSSPTQSQPADSNHIQPARTEGSLLSSDDLTTVSKYQLSTSTCGDEDVFSPGHRLTPLPLPSTRRDVLSTTASDDVFVSPPYLGGVRGDDTIDGGQRPPADDFNEINREKLLDHVVLSRPKGPAARRKPLRSLEKSTPSKGDNTNNAVTEHNKSESLPIETKVLDTDPTQRADPADRLKLEPTHQSKPDSRRQSNSTLSTRESISPPNIEERVPATHLTSLSPEIHQEAVVEGWSEGVSGERGDGVRGEEDVDGDVAQTNVGVKHTSGTQGVKELSHRIHALKKEIKNFEVTFQSTHGHKPVGSEKAPIRKLIEEASVLRKQLKALEDSSPTISPPREVTTNSKDSISKPHHRPERRITVSGGEVYMPSTNLGGLVDQQPASREEKGLVVSRKENVKGQTSTSEAKAKRSKSLAVCSQTADDGGGSLQLHETLAKLMSSLGTRRTSSGRPEQVNEMCPSQLQQEKRDIQKVLLQFEKIHGRPTIRQDKETMRPLYDRYRLVKRLSTSLEVGKKESLSSYSLTSPRSTLESTIDSLPSVTLLQSSTLALSLPGVPEPKSVVSHTHRTLSKSAHEMRTENTSNSPTHSQGKKDGSVKDKPGSSSGEVMSDSQLKLATLEELTQQNKLLLDEKKYLRKTLKDYENQFQAQYGRYVQKEDRGPMQEDYDRYKLVKTRLKMVNLLVAKINPQRTI